MKKDLRFYLKKALALADDADVRTHVRIALRRLDESERRRARVVRNPEMIVSDAHTSDTLAVIDAMIEVERRKLAGSESPGGNLFG